MAKSFKDLVQKMSPQAQKAVTNKAKTLLAEMRLQELRQARSMSQEQLALALATKQANVSRMERRSDMHISTLRSYIEAMGGQLSIVASFPEGDVQINQF